MNVFDEVMFYDTNVDHVRGTKGTINTIHEGLNCVTICYGFDDKLIQVNKCQVMVLKKEKKSDS